MFTIVIKLVQLFTITVDTTSSIDKIIKQLLLDEQSFFKILLLRNDEWRILSEEKRTEYLYTLESVLKPIKLKFSKTQSILDHEHNIIDKFCAEMLNFSNLTKKLPACSQNYASYFNFHNAILEMLAKNDVFPLENNKSLSSGFIHGFILDEIEKSNHEDVKQFKEGVNQIFALLFDDISIFYGNDTKNIPELNCCESFVRFQNNITKMTQLVYQIYNILDKCKNSILYEEYCTLKLSIWLIDYIIYAFIEYSRFIYSFETMDKNCIEKAFSEYAREITNIVVLLFHLAIQPSHVSYFIEKIEPEYSKINMIASGSQQRSSQ